MPENNTDWGLKKEFLHSTRQNLWNNDYFEFLVKCVWKIDKPVRIIDFGCGYGYLAQMLLPLVPKGKLINLVTLKRLQGFFIPRT